MDIERFAYGDGDPEVSVVTVHYYDEPEWYAKCVDSIAQQQGLKNWEHVIVKAQGTDESIGFCKNFGIQSAYADWVYFLDDDDWVKPQCLASALTEGVDVVLMRAILVDKTGAPWSSGPGSIGLVKKSLFDDVPYPDKSLREDSEWLAEMKDRGVLIKTMREPMEYYRLHRGQASNSIKDDGHVYSVFEERGAQL